MSWPLKTLTKRTLQNVQFCLLGALLQNALVRGLIVNRKCLYINHLFQNIREIWTGALTLPIYVSIYVSICVSIFLSIYLSTYLHLSAPSYTLHLSTPIHTYLPTYLPIYLPFYLSIGFHRFHKFPYVRIHVHLFRSFFFIFLLNSRERLREGFF